MEISISTSYRGLCSAKDDTRRFDLPTGPNSTDQLFRNDLTTDEEGNAHVSFVNVTESSGIDARGYGMEPR